MSKDPAFLFYPGDWLGGTMHLSWECKGAYMDLLMLQFQRGHMTSHMVGQVLGQRKPEIWPQIEDKFKTDGKVFWNERLRIEIERRKNFTKSRNNNLSGKNQHSKKEANTLGHMTSHMESVNENVTINKDIIEKSVFEDQIFMAEMNRMHKGKNLKKAWDECWSHFSQQPTKLEDWQWRQKFSGWLSRSKENNGHGKNRAKLH